MNARPEKQIIFPSRPKNAGSGRKARVGRATTWFAIAVSLIGAPNSRADGPPPIDLGSDAHFAVLGTSTVTTTGGGIVNGDVGLSPSGSQGIPPSQINGVIYNGGPVASQAQLDLSSAIIAASPAQLPGGINLGNGELGGRVLAPGVYQSAPGSYDITLEDLTLNGGPNDVWVFQMASTLTLGVGRQIILTGGAQARNIFWQVGSSATLQTSSVFKGTIMAYASVTMNSSATIEGRALAQTGAVTFNGSASRLPMPAAPVFTGISYSTNAVTLVLHTTPYYLLTVQSCPDLTRPSWSTVLTTTPATSSLTILDDTETPGLPRLFYRAFLSTP